jgi:hypothetical protein
MNAAAKVQDEGEGAANAAERKDEGGVREKDTHRSMEKLRGGSPLFCRQLLIHIWNSGPYQH